MPYRVAVIVRTKNRPLFLARVLESLQRQSFQAFRLYVVNDGGDPDEVFRVMSMYGPRDEDRVVQTDIPQSVGRA
ncbi:glycosyltransferase [Bombella sp. TMW 2.2559]|uniref:Glycosyltransferase n=1 Tax=Bombella dulcis TaxID=2967339 RepID=A0ABT3WB78_9PROT|nr:glycosyltransferase [Bombella dulcis]MCX5616347.1 glycosyltransferase [Bombella dulcis]